MSTADSNGPARSGGGEVVGEVDLNAISVNTATMARARLSTTAIQDYTKAMIAGDVFPPVVLFTNNDSKYHIGGGHHRIRAARRARIETKLRTIRAIVRRGSQRDALLHAVRSNHVHGVRRTREDKRLAVDSLLEDKTWRKSSNEELARLAGVSPGLVGNRRKHMERTLHNAECSTRKTADGREMRVGNIGRKRTESAAPTCAISNVPDEPATHTVDRETLETQSTVVPTDTSAAIDTATDTMPKEPSTFSPADTQSPVTACQVTKAADAVPEPNRGHGVLIRCEQLYRRVGPVDHAWFEGVDPDTATRIGSWLHELSHAIMARGGPIGQRPLPFHEANMPLVRSGNGEEREP